MATFSWGQVDTVESDLYLYLCEALVTGRVSGRLPDEGGFSSVWDLTELSTGPTGYSLPRLASSLYIPSLASEGRGARESRLSGQGCCIVAIS